MRHHGLPVLAVFCILLTLCAVAAEEGAPTVYPDAKPLSVESLGVLQRNGRATTWVLVPGTDKYPARALIGFFSMADRHWFASFVINLENGTAREAKGAGFADGCLTWPTISAPDGKVFCNSHHGGLVVYDPVTDVIKKLRPIPDAWSLRCLARGPDGGIYMSDYPRGSAARYDPDTGAIEYYGQQGGPFYMEPRCIYGYSVASDGEWVYTATGKMPWYVVAHHRKTGEQKILLKYTPDDFPRVRQRKECAVVNVKIVDRKNNTSRQESYVLKGGKALKLAAGEPGPEGQERKPMPDAAKDRPQPWIPKLGTFLEMEKGGAVFWYRKADVAGKFPKRWKEGIPYEEQGGSKVLLPIPGEPWELKCVEAMSDGRLFIATGTYGSLFIYDPATGKFTDFGHTGPNVHCILEKDGTLYYAGYPNGRLGTVRDGKSVKLFDWNQMLGSKRTKHILTASDKRIYLGHLNEREATGGGLGWWDPAAPEGERAGGIAFPNDQCDSLTTALDGRYVVYAGRAVYDPRHPDIHVTDGRIMVYDTREQRIVKQFTPLPGEKQGGAAGSIREIRPGVIAGFSLRQGKPVMYTAEIPAGRVLGVEPLPGRQRGSLAMGPDGKLYTFIEDVLVRMDPKTLAITPVGRAQPGPFTFLGSDLYLAGTPELRRLGSITER